MLIYRAIRALMSYLLLQLFRIHPTCVPVQMFNVRVSRRELGGNTGTEVACYSCLAEQIAIADNNIQ